MQRELHCTPSYVPRSLEVCQLWKHCLLCQRKEPIMGHGASNTSSLSRTYWGTLSLNLRSWGKTLTSNRLRQARSTSIIYSMHSYTQSTLHLYQPACSGNAEDINPLNTDHPSVLEGSTAAVAFLCEPGNKIELIHRGK